MFGGIDNFAIIRDTDVSNAALVSAGRFGVVYSIVLQAVPQYALHEKRRMHVWQNIKDQIKHGDSALHMDVSPGGTVKAQRFLQVAISLTTHANFQRNLVDITKRWDVPMAPGIVRRGLGMRATLSVLRG